MTQKGLSTNYHLRFDIKLGMGICVIFLIPCASVTCTYMIDKPWISGILTYEQERYKTVAKCTYFPVLGSFTNWNIIQFSQKPTPFDAFDETHQVFFM